MINFALLFHFISFLSSWRTEQKKKTATHPLEATHIALQNADKRARRKKMSREGPTFWITGAAKSGKTTLFKHLTQKESVFTVKSAVEFEGETISTRFFDATTARMGTKPMHEVDVVLILLDLSSEKGLSDVTSILEDLKKVPNIKRLYLIGNKIDLVADRKISENEAKSFADQHSMLYFEMSTLCNVQVDETFEIIKENTTCFIKDTRVVAYLSPSKTASCLSNCCIL